MLVIMAEIENFCYETENDISSNIMTTSLCENEIGRGVFWKKSIEDSF